MEQIIMFSVLLFTKKCGSILRTITNNSERCRRTAPTAYTKFYNTGGNAMEREHSIQSYKGIG